MKIARIFILLFLPMALWVLYSWSDNTLLYGSLELRKIDKIELIKLLVDEKSSLTPLSPVEAVNDTVIKESTAPVQEDKEALNKTDSSKAEKPTLIPPLSGDVHTQVPIKELESVQGSQHRIFVIGDSMGEGIVMGLSRLKKEFNFSYTSLAKCSTTTQYWLNYPKLEERITSYKPTVIFIVLGTNEYAHVTSATIVRMIKLRKRLESLGIEMRWITPPVEHSTQFFEAVREVFGDNVYDSRFVNIPRGEDHIHSTPHGYEVWGREILNSLHVPRRSSR